MVSFVVALLVSASPPPDGDLLSMNQTWDTLTATTSHRAKLREAGRKLGWGRINLAGIWIDGVALRAVANIAQDQPLTRVLREAFERPIDVEDFLLFTDDVIRMKRDLVKHPAHLPAGRARAVGVLLHPHDIFRKGVPRRYAKTATVVSLAPLTEQITLTPADDGEVVGPRWAARYQQPLTEQGRMRALERANPNLAARVRSLIGQLKSQGAAVFVESTVRPRERGYLLYGSFVLSRSKNKKQLLDHIAQLRTFNKDWGLQVPIKWLHPAGWRATIDAARELADTFGVVYATPRGARASDHYDGSAVDLFVVNLPRRLKLRAPDGARWTADLSGANESRDLSLSPQVIRWIEKHFHLQKLRRDYPHWRDAKKRRTK